MSSVRRFPTTQQFIDGAEDFRRMVETARADLQHQFAIEASADGQFADDGLRDCCVVVRARPILDMDPYDYSIIGRSAAPPPTTALSPDAAAAPGAGSYCTVLAPSVSLKGARSVEIYPYGVDAVFTGGDDTKSIYDKVCRQLVKRAMEGSSAAIVAYGQTGSGKTYTTLGLVDLIASDLFPDGSVAPPVVTMVAVEVIGDSVKDLIAERDVAIFDDPVAGVVIRGAEEVAVGSKDKLLELVRTASERRRTRVTARNAAGSSRTHMALQLHFKPSEGQFGDGLLTLVDLAGSENAHDSATHDRELIKETKQINTSLMTLKDCIRTRAEALTAANKHVHIPYRQSKLTLLLKDAFDLAAWRPAKTLVITCVSPVCVDVKHTCNTLKYASQLAATPAPPPKAPSPENPLFWSHEAVLRFFSELPNGGAAVANAIAKGGADGRRLASAPEAEFARRLQGIPGADAHELYLAFWGKLVDARSVPRGSAAAVTNTKRTREGEDQSLGEEVGNVMPLLSVLEAEEQSERDGIDAASRDALDVDILLHFADIMPHTAAAAVFRVTMRLGPAATAAKMAQGVREC